MNDTLKRYLNSTLQTFLAGFLPALYIVMENGDAFSDVTSAAVFGAIFAGVRLVIKFGAEKYTGRI